MHACVRDGGDTVATDFLLRYLLASERPSAPQNHDAADRLPAAHLSDQLEPALTSMTQYSLPRRLDPGLCPRYMSLGYLR